MNRRIIAWMLASCMAMSMAGPVLAEAAAGTDNNVTADSKEPAESNTDTKETTDKGEAGTTEGEAGKTDGEAGKTEGEAGKTKGEAGTTEGEAGKTEGEAGKTEGEADTTEGETGKTEGEAGKTEGEGADANGTPANSETTQPNNAVTTTADETTVLAEGSVDLVGIADPRIRSRALKAANVTSGTVVTDAELKSITSLDISGLGIEALTGIDLLTSLTSLDASKNNIADLGAVASWGNLTNLKTLDLSENKVGTLSPLNASKLTTLKLNKQRPEDKGTVLDLDITGTNLNISTLTTLEVRDCNLGSLAVANALTTLIASDNPKLSGAVGQLQDSAKSSLEKLDLSNCNIGDARGLSGFTALSDLNLSGNTPLNDTSIITGLSGLEKLDLSGTSITGLKGISASSKLVTLDVSNTKMENFGTLGAGNKSTLTTLNASNAPIKTLTGLAEFTKISSLDVSGTQITDTQGLKNLSSLKANNESLNLTGTRIKTSGDLTTGLPSSVTGDSSDYNSWLAALKTNLGIDDSNGIEQAKNVLETLIGDAQKLLGDTEVSVNGSDVPTNKMWVVQSVETEFTNAIAAAQTALSATGATESSLANARDALGTAQTAFTTARKRGTKAEINTTVLSTAIGAADAAKAVPKVDSAAENVLEGQKWVTQLEKDALDTAITKARELLEKATNNPDAVTQEELNTAAATLDKAVETFQTAYKSGTKKASFKDGLGSALNNQNGFVKSVIASTDGSNVPYSKNWAQQADIDKFKAEIAKAQAIYDKADATQPEVSNAVTALNAARTTFDKVCALGTQKVTITEAASPTANLTLPLNGTATIKVSDLATDCGEQHGDLIIKSATPASPDAGTVTAQIAPDKKSATVTGAKAGDVSLTITVSCNRTPCNAEEEFAVACKVNSVITAFEPLEDVDAGAADALTDDFKDLTAAAAKLKKLHGTVTVKGASAKANVDSWKCTSANANSYPAAGTYVFTANLNTTPPTDYTYGEGVKATVNVVVKPGNNAPTAKSVPTQTVKVGGAKATLPVPSLASDADNDELTITKVTQPTDGSATVTYTNDTLTITPVKAGNGSTTVTVSDGKTTVDVPVNITVNEAASIPEKTIADRKLAVKSVDEINVSDLAADCTDGHKNLKIVKASSSVPTNATVQFDDGKVTVTGAAAGEATITVEVACGGASGTTCAARRAFSVKYTVEAEAAEKFTLTQNATNATVEFYTDASATAMVSGDKVNKGSQIWVKVTPDADHEISAFTINGADKKADLKNGIAGPYTINQNTTVSASAVQIDHTPTVTIKNATGTYKVEPPTTTTNKYTVTVTLKLPTGFKAEKVEYYVEGDPSKATPATGTDGVYSFAADPDKAYIVFVTTAADDSYKKVEISKDVTAITTAVVKEDQIPDVPTDQPNGKSVVLTISNPAAPATPDELKTAGTTLAAQNSNIQAIDTDKAIQMDISLQVLDASNQKVGEAQPKSGGITVLMNVPAAFKGKDFLALHYKDNTSIPAIIYPNILEGGEQFSITTTSLSTFVLAPYTKASRPAPTPSPTPSNNGSGGGSGGGGGSSGGRSTGVFDKLTSTINGLLKQALTGMKPGTASGTVSNGTPVTAAAANKAAASAIAKGKGDGSGKADVLFRNASTISPEILSSIASQAQKAGLKAYVTVDSMQKGAVDVRVSVLASAAARLGKAIDLSARTGNQAIERHFAKYFKNRIAVIDLAQNGPFGTPASVAARVNLGADAKELHVYAYNVATNAYREIPQEEIFVDSNGYVHFTTDTGGCIILSVGTLTRK